MRNGLRTVLIAGAIALNPAAPVLAQQDLTIRPGESWTHAHSGIAVPPTLGGNVLTKAKAYAADELDVGLSFEPEGTKDYISFYIFRNTNGGVPVWFAQAQRAIEKRGAFGELESVEPAHAFAPPGQSTASGLKAVYAAKSGGFASTGVALFPVGDWYVKLRVSSQVRSAADLSRLIDSVIAEVRWPANVPANAALPVVPCASPLNFAKASKDLPGDGMTEILGAALLSAAADAKPDKAEGPTAPVQWCLDSTLDVNIGAYRPDQSTAGYLLAIGDNGNGAWTGPSAMTGIMAEIEKKRVATRYGVTLHTAGQDINFIAQDRLPSPARVYEIVAHGRRGSTVTTWGDKRNVEINSGAIK